MDCGLKPLTLVQENLRWTNFLVFFKKHRYISPDGILRVKRHVDPIPLKLIIHKITNVMVSKPEGEKDTETKNFAVLSATFFSKSNSAFVGRTYKTKPIELVFDSGNSSYATLDFHASYFYSQVDNPEDVVLVLDLEVKSK